MKNLSLKTTFGQLKGGSIFAKVDNLDVSQLLTGDKEHVEGCRFKDTRGYIKMNAKGITPNALLIISGEIRTFSPEDEVYEYKIEKI